MVVVVVSQVDAQAWSRMSAGWTGEMSFPCSHGGRPDLVAFVSSTGGAAGEGGK